MYCNAITQSYHPENPVAILRNTPPEPYPVVGLNLNAQRMLNDPNAPLLLEIRPLAQNFIVKIAGEVVDRHRTELDGNLLRAWCTRQGSNLRPSDPKSDALSN